MYDLTSCLIILPLSSSYFVIVQFNLMSTFDIELHLNIYIIYQLKSSMINETKKNLFKAYLLIVTPTMWVLLYSYTLIY